MRTRIFSITLDELPDDQKRFRLTEVEFAFGRFFGVRIIHWFDGHPVGQCCEGLFQSLRNIAE